MAELSTTLRYETVEGAARSLGPPRRMREHRPPGETTLTRARRSALDRGLDLLEQEQLSATELRLLLALLDGEAAVPKLVQTLGLSAAQIRWAAERLYARDLVRWREVAGPTTILDLKTAGLTAVRPLAAAGDTRPGAE